MLNLGRCVDHCESDEDILTLDGSKNVRLVKSGNPMCAHSYLVTRKGAEILLKHTWPFFAVWDMMPILLYKLAKEQQFHMLSATPRLFDQDRVEIKDSLHQDENLECDVSSSSHYMRLYSILSWKGDMAWEGNQFQFQRETMSCRY